MRHVRASRRCDPLCPSWPWPSEHRPGVGVSGVVAREVSAIHPRAEYVEVAGSGHSVYFEDAAAFNDHVGAFLAKHLGAGAAK